MAEIQVVVVENFYHHGKEVEVKFKDVKGDRTEVYVVRHIHQDGSGYEYASLIPKI